ncbi:NAD(P)-dependent alcohol dehydrogenase [Demequina sp.]|uniref:NAD(P)-dependent alcohol dehydrogenase n=1 Tax=Demequina sp. TaxID=2050685 RepID=UPI0025C59962|nr:NAD(P)-dependent alcohol dehydrogenase [Demequina sp.]
MTHTPATMTAVMHHHYGEADVLSPGTVPVPTPGPRDVLLRVKATALNPADVFLTRGKPAVVRLGLGLRRPRQTIRGSDVAGIVEAVGADVTQWRVGDEVFGEGRATLAEYALAAEDKVTRIPAGITFEAAAATTMAGLAALHGLRVRPVGPGDKVLVIGASGGIGSFAVQMAAAAGATVTGVCSSGNVQAVLDLGAHRVIDYTSESVLDTEERFDLIFDNVAADRMLALEKLTTATGVLLPNSGEPGPDGGALARVTKAAWRGKVLRKRIGVFYSSPNQQDLRALADMLTDGSLTVLMDTMFTLSHGADAMQRVASRHARGKVVVSVP